jgi:hypothetical protein
LLTARNYARDESCEIIAVSPKFAMVSGAKTQDF